MTTNSMILNLRVCKRIYSTKQRVQKHRCFDEQLFNDCPDETDIFGYSQSESILKMPLRKSV